MADLTGKADLNMGWLNDGGVRFEAKTNQREVTGIGRMEMGMRERIRLSGSRLRVKISYPVKSTGDEISSYHIACSPVFRMAV